MANRSDLASVAKSGTELYQPGMARSTNACDAVGSERHQLCMARSDTNCEQSGGEHHLLDKD